MAFPSQRIRQWDGAYTDPTQLPGVAAAEINLQAGDFAFVKPGSFAIAIPYYCTSATFPATWVPGQYLPVSFPFSGTTGANATLYSVVASGTSIATLPMRFPVNLDTYFSQLRVYASVNTLSVACQITVYKNGAATGITLSVGAGSTGLSSDLAHNSTFAAGDGLDLQTSTPAGSGSLRFSAVVSGFQTSIVL